MFSLWHKRRQALTHHSARFNFDDVDASFMLDRKDVSLGNWLGSGAFGDVFMCNCKDSTKQMVAKRTELRRLRKEDHKVMRQEILVMTLLDHPNAIKLCGLVSDVNEILMICEFCDGGSLEAVHKERRERGVTVAVEPEVVNQMLQIADAMAHMHELGYIHRDLKTANILVHGRNLKVADFGLVCKRPEHRASLTAETGSYRWMAPEVMRHEPYNELVDVYSYALVLYEMLTLIPPFEELLPLEAAFGVADRALRPSLPGACVPMLASLIVHCWQQRPEDRPPFEEVVLTLDAIISGLKSADFLAPLTPATAVPSRCGSPPANDPNLSLPPPIHAGTKPSGGAHSGSLSVRIPVDTKSSECVGVPLNQFSNPIKLQFKDWRNPARSPTPSDGSTHLGAISPQWSRKRLLTEDDDTQVPPTKMATSPKMAYGDPSVELNFSSKVTVR